MNPKNIWTIWKREIGAYFNSPIAYIYLIVFVAIVDGLFMSRFFLLGRAEMRPFFDDLPLILLIFIPVIAMRLWAEDRRENTFELLMTFPMRAIELTLGKFFASFTFILAALASTAVVPVMLFWVGRPDAGAIVSSYLGAALLGAFFLAIGIFVSGLTKEQIVAFVVTILGGFLLYFLGIEFFAALIDGWVAGLGAFLMKTLGAAHHLDAFFKGVLTFRDAAYFFLGTALFLLLNSLYLESRFRPRARWLFGASAAVCAAIFMTANWLLADISWGRFDATEGKIYTVAAATRRILKNLDAPVFITVYITPAEKMPTALKTHEQEITGKLSELRLASGGKLNYKVVPVEAAQLMENQQRQQAGEEKGAKREPTLAERLRTKGIAPFQVESIDRDQVEVKLVYAALTIDYKDRLQETLPRIFPDAVQDLEYLIMSRIAKIARDKKPKISLFAPLGMADMTPEMRSLLARQGQSTEQFQDEYATIGPLLNANGYLTERVALTPESLPAADSDVLLVFKPGALDDRQLYEINKFLYQGGKVLIAAQGFEYSFQLQPPNGVSIIPMRQNLAVNKILAKWGVKIDDQMLFDESNDVITVSTGERTGPFAGEVPLRVPNQIVVRQEFMRPNLPLMSRQAPFLYLWGSVLTVATDLIKGGGLDYSILFTSSKRSWRARYNPGIFGTAPVPAQDLVFPAAGSPGKFALGIMMQGQFADAFADGPVPAWPQEKEKEGPAAAQEQKTQEPKGELVPRPGKLILIGCAKAFSDPIISNRANLNLFANIVDGLALGDDIIQIRAKTQSGRQIKRLTDAQKALWRFAAVGLVPAFWAVFACVRFFFRRKEKQFYILARRS
ncbi:MAG: Gldg family protein [Deltaproteobacteria bacterium]